MKDNTESKAKAKAQKAKSPTDSTDKSDEFLQKVTDWMNKLGSHFSKIALKLFYTDYRGVVATDDIAKGEVIVFVPKEGMITLSLAKSGRIGKKLVEKGVSMVLSLIHI
eukprot:TRINITY_DN1784_c0_g2_i1.p3 TRINITY_DN1784_c0_g2~~TRINITY_DN1784_c0_g2_i1.p3  ORF type:complete len:109 (+),score=34.35 TRINITY_DN1784_c0_g2_i1:45-371(+)